MVSGRLVLLIETHGDAEEELDRRLGRFYDLLIIHFVRG